MPKTLRGWMCSSEWAGYWEDSEGEWNVVRQVAPNDYKIISNKIEKAIWIEANYVPWRCDPAAALWSSSSLHRQPGMFICWNIYNIFIVVVFFGSRRRSRGRYTWSDSGRVPRVTHTHTHTQPYTMAAPALAPRVIHALLPQRPIWSHVRTPINPIRWKAKGSLPISPFSTFCFPGLIFVASFRCSGFGPPAPLRHWPHRRTSWWKKY